MEKQVYPKMNPKIVAQVFLGMFALACFRRQNWIRETNTSVQQMQEMGEGLADIFLTGVLLKNE
ncbi:hypothetical protein [Microcoleus vaginatus]|uniref:hypothetical protein n=1 Tax=Microcoleus vaginatus TaxID=119532 RepID=UPI001683B1B4|nr:hypothetical protein [Microcoleus sp. FACHB-84]MBD2008030.1 hypothetical protein [Microcoleus sp. FACHB-45]